MPTAEKLLELKEAEEKARIEAVEAEVTPLVAYMRKKRDEKARRMKVRTTIVALTQGVFATRLICQRSTLRPTLMCVEQEGCCRGAQAQIERETGT
eukprot:COSAG01_NODE_824_length_13299_cov_22.451364_14_plen_96_part_00